MKYIIGNDEFEAVVDSKGCEITSVIRKADGKQYIWSGEPDIWKRHTPVLFPLVGRYRDDTSIYEGREYHMKQHGFARDSEFELIRSDDNIIIMRLCSNPETLKVYPFEFMLTIVHRISGNCITTTWEVNNPSDRNMLFSIGGHPAFVCGESAVGAQIRFETNDNKVTYRLLSSDGLLLPEQYSMSLGNKNVAIREDFFDKDAYIVENSDIHKVSLCKDCEPVVEVLFDAPVFGLWSAVGKGVPFVCIEPWYGRTDRVDSDYNLTHREWGNVLGSGEVFRAGYKMKFM